MSGALSLLRLVSPAFCSSLRATSLARRTACCGIWNDPALKEPAADTTIWVNLCQLRRVASRRCLSMRVLADCHAIFVLFGVDETAAAPDSIAVDDTMAIEPELSRRTAWRGPPISVKLLSVSMDVASPSAGAAAAAPSVGLVRSRGGASSGGARGSPSFGGVAIVLHACDAAPTSMETCATRLRVPAGAETQPPHQTDATDL
mmetsp:Transcript_24105/g.71909  ORF Transcript_24105/g.71909 Transcript_24105/m.71909 type:complete len:203 (+) Transcript_24105:5986-6594(+)